MGEFCKYLLRTKGPANLKRLPSLQTSCPRKTKKPWRKQSRKPLNGLMTTRKQRRKSLKKNRKNSKRRPTQSFKRFTKQALVAKELHQKKKTWMTKTVMNFKIAEMCTV